MENRLKNYALSRINEYSKMKMNDISPLFGKECYVVPDSTGYDPENKVFTIEFTVEWIISKKILGDLLAKKNAEEKHPSFRGKCTLMQDFTEKIIILSRNEDYLAAEASREKVLTISGILLFIKNLSTALNDESNTIYSF